MDTVMMAVTGLSLAMAIGMGFVVEKLLREERQRSNARVAALAEMAAEQGPHSRPSEGAAGSGTAGAAGLSGDLGRAHAAPAARRGPSDVRRPMVAARPARPADHARLDDLEIRPANETVTGVAELFTTPSEPSVWGRRLGVAGGLTLLVVGIASGIASFAARGEKEPGAATGNPAMVGAATGNPAMVGAATGNDMTPGAPLELLSLQHTRQPGSITIAGLVQNPRNGAALTHAVATALVLGPEGALLSSARAPLDFTTIAPGDESPFVVTVPVIGDVTRYRIGFRSADGRVIAHVDKRVPDALASR